MVAGHRPWQVLSALPAWQLTQVHRVAQPCDDGPAGDGAAQRAAELVSAWCRSAPVAVAWVRERAGGPIRVITAGPGIGAGSDNGQDVLTLPAGARGLPLDGGEAARLLAALPCWVQLAGVCDALLAEGVPLPGMRSWGRRRRPGCGGCICSPGARHRSRRRRSPGCCAPLRTWRACRMRCCPPGLPPRRLSATMSGGFVVDEDAVGAERVALDDTVLKYPFRTGAEMLRLTTDAGLHYYLTFVPGADEDGIVRLLLRAGAVGMLFKEYASISGADRGGLAVNVIEC
ncbi:MAG: L-serine dehydratase [Actinomycetia bacterium]|nr:L-serine dehydratase [Actinomycetes bacterium]